MALLRGGVLQQQLLVFAAIMSLMNYANCAGLRVGFYSKICPLAESIVKQEVAKALSANTGIAAGLLRLHFHDCFVRGCDGSVLIDSTLNNVAEKDAPPNRNSLRGFEVVDSAKSRLESVCHRTVSCADILAFAARDSVQLSGGPTYNVPSGRRDGVISRASETTSLPPPSANLSQLTQMFAANELSLGEMVTLSGAHTMGRSHCSSFMNRLYNFSSTASQDPNLDPALAAQLKKQCPNGSASANVTVPMDPGSPYTMDVGYYRDVLAHRALFQSDMALLSGPSAASLVRQNAQNSLLFQGKFAAAMVKMGQIQVLTGSQGEIRAICRSVNK